MKLLEIFIVRICLENIYRCPAMISLSWSSTDEVRNTIFIVSWTKLV